MGREKCSRDESDIKLYFFLSLSPPVKQHVTQDKITLSNLTQGGVACFNSTRVRRTLSLLVGGPKKNGATCPFLVIVFTRLSENLPSDLDFKIKVTEISFDPRFFKCIYGINLILITLSESD